MEQEINYEICKTYSYLDAKRDSDAALFWHRLTNSYKTAKREIGFSIVSMLLTAGLFGMFGLVAFSV